MSELGHPLFLIPLSLLLIALACGQAEEITKTITPPVPDATTTSSSTMWKSVQVDGQEREYLLYLPSNFEATSPLPVVLVFHGGGGNAEATVEITGFNHQADESGFVVVYPNGSGRLENSLLTWNGGYCCGYAMENEVDDVAFVRALIDDLNATFPLDRRRIYATGVSNGGILAYYLACELSDRIAAIGAVSGTHNLTDCQPERPVPVIHFHGTDDQNILYEGGYGPRSLTEVDYASVSHTVGFWVDHNGCQGQPSEEQFGRIFHTVYAECRGSSAVELYTIHDGGHAWPGGRKPRPRADEPTQEISATELLWAFFRCAPHAISRCEVHLVTQFSKACMHDEHGQTLGDL